MCRSPNQTRQGVPVNLPEESLFGKHNNLQCSFMSDSANIQVKSADAMEISVLKIVHCLILLTVTTVDPGSIVAQNVKSTNLPVPTVTTATVGVFTAFQTHNLVGLGDHHRMAQELDFYSALIRDPHFAKGVGNVVVEFGDAAQQQTIDRYLSGKDVPYEELRKVWADTVGWIPTVVALGYINFYAEVREVNLGLPPEQRIHVWLGDPPIDWSKITRASDLEHMPDRDRYAADLIESQILAKRRKALVIYGTFHFYGQGSLKELVEQHYPGSFFVINPYVGFIEESCSDIFEQDTGAWPTPAIVSPVRGTMLATKMRSPGCHVLSRPTAKMTEAQKTQAAIDDEQISGVDGDALLYLGSARSLTWSPFSPDMYLDEGFWNEIARRIRIHGGDATRWPAVEDNPMSPRYLRPCGGLYIGEKRP